MMVFPDVHGAISRSS